jgi:Zn-dependent metalloprotease
MKHTICNIIPNHILLEMIKQEDDEGLKGSLLNTMINSTRLRSHREILGSLASVFPTGGAGKQRSIFDSHSFKDESVATSVRQENDSQSNKDNVVNEVFDSLGYTYDLYFDAYKRKSIDDADMPLNGYIHWGKNFNNAFWDGKSMKFGDGDQRLFKSFTSAIDITGHELTHGVTQYEAGLEYWVDETHQPGAINESISDCFGSMVKQFALKQTADTADWLIGEGIFKNDSNWALRSMKDPGKASPYDKQPSHMKDFKPLPNDEFHDEGGVHFFSGIPNHAFFLTATKIGGKVWERTGLIWYKTLNSGLPVDCDFETFANHTFQIAGLLYKEDSEEQKAVRDAWHEVGILKNI